LAWEIKLFQRTGLAYYENCLRLFEAYANSAPFWERALLSAYVGLGPPVARIFGGNTKTVWAQAELIIADLFAVSGMTPDGVLSELRRYMKIKQELDNHLQFEQACELIYNQNFYPIVTHFTFAFQSSAVARLRFVRRTASAVAFSQATVADLGCGSGAMLCEVLQSNPGWTGFGLDISRESVDYARRLAALKGVANRSHFQQGSIGDLPFRNGSVHLVIASEVIEHLPEPQKAFSEIARVLAPGGLLALTVPIDSHTPAHMNSLSDENDFHELCRHAGLSVRSLKSKWHLTFGDDSRHLFAVAQSGGEDEVARDRVYSLSPQISSAASTGIVSS